MKRIKYRRFFQFLTKKKQHLYVSAKNWPRSRLPEFGPTPHISEGLEYLCIQSSYKLLSVITKKHLTKTLKKLANKCEIIKRQKYTTVGILKLSNQSLRIRIGTHYGWVPGPLKFHSNDSICQLKLYCK